MSFTENTHINKEKNRITIKITCKEKRYAIDPDFIFTDKIEKYIPEEYIQNTKLLKSPTKTVSNLDYIDHALTGEWIYEIITSEPPAPAKPKTTRRTRKAK